MVASYDSGIELKGFVIDIDYVTLGKRGIIRVSFKNDADGTVVPLFDPSFYPYMYLVPFRGVSAETLKKVGALSETNEEIFPLSVEERQMTLGPETVRAFKIVANHPREIPKLKESLSEFGECYEYDIVFWKRYLIDKGIVPLSEIYVKAHREDESGGLVIDEIRESGDTAKLPDFSHVSFDIETYNVAGIPRPEKDPVIMISYKSGNDSGVLTTKKISKDFVSVFENEKALVKGFVNIINKIDPDIIVGYNSSNFDIPYLIARAKANRIGFDIARFGDEVKREHHGLIEAVKIPGRINFDVYNVAKFVSVVGAAEQLIKVNSLQLGEVYEAITGKHKKRIDKIKIWQQWDAGDLDDLSEYSLDDSNTLDELFDFFLPLMVEVSKVSGTVLGEAAISTTGQLVEYLLMRYASKNNQIIPNKPKENEIEERNANPIEGAYVKMPDAGIYENIVAFDFRSLYPSIIIAHNIDNSTICSDCKDYYESPTGVKFRKDVVGIAPTILKRLIDERTEVKKAYKKNPDNKALGARSMALKILANSFYGYLGYARSRWYSRECAASVTAFGRAYITKTIEEAEKHGFKVLYGDTDSLFLLMGNKTKEDAYRFMKEMNDTLPGAMELDLEDFYVRGVFVSKRVGVGGAKKKYALLSEEGRIKIKGFELVRRDWAKIARDTQKAVLEAILREGSKEKAAAIVKETIDKIRSGKLDIKEFVIHTQLRKGIGNYDIKSPELAAAQKAMKAGVKRRDELEGAAIGYVITKHGNSISEKAMIEEMADDYDPDYYINNQVMPATLKILKELGYNADELKAGGSQKKL